MFWGRGASVPVRALKPQNIKTSPLHKPGSVHAYTLHRPPPTLALSGAGRHLCPADDDFSAGLHVVELILRLEPDCGAAKHLHRAAELLCDPGGCALLECSLEYALLHGAGDECGTRARRGDCTAARRQRLSRQAHRHFDPAAANDGDAGGRGHGLAADVRADRRRDQLCPG